MSANVAEEKGVNFCPITELEAIKAPAGWLRQCSSDPITRTDCCMVDFTDQSIYAYT